MSSRLKQITTKAKALYKSGKYKKWTDAIKAASKTLTSTVKKAKVGAFTKKKSPAKSLHKDTKSHNVNIKVLSGVNNIKFDKKNLDKTQSYYTYKGKKHEIREDQEGKHYISVNGKILYLKINRISGWSKGSTAFRETKEKKINKFNNVRVHRTPKGSLYKAGTFAHFNKIAGLFDTSVIKDIDTLKKQYFNLAKKYHPDAGGTTTQFQQLQNEYDKLFKSLLSGSSLNSEQKNNEIEIDEAIRKIIDQLINIENITVEVIGKWLWIGGNTYPVKTTLKSVGLSFIKKAGVPYWVYKGVESSSRGTMSLDEIKAKYGVHKFDIPKTKSISGINKINKTKLKINLLKLMKSLNKRPI